MLFFRFNELEITIFNNNNNKNNNKLRVSTKIKKKNPTIYNRNACKVKETGRWSGGECTNQKILKNFVILKWHFFFFLGKNSSWIKNKT